MKRAFLRGLSLLVAFMLVFLLCACNDKDDDDSKSKDDKADESRNGANAEDTAKDFAEAIFDFDFDKVEEYSFIDIEKYSKDNEDLDASELEQMFENRKDDYYEYEEDMLGDNIKITVTIKDSQELKGDEMDEAISTYEEYEDYYKGEIKTVTKVTVLLEFKGDDDEESNEEDLYVVKSGSKWYILNSIEPIGSFLSN